MRCAFSLASHGNRLRALAIARVISRQHKLRVFAGMLFGWRFDIRLTASIIATGCSPIAFIAALRAE